jgi:hypothetical protein
VSEYQYYEFRALDRRLTAEQQRRLRSLSSRAEISATRFTNEYSFGDFRGDPGRLLEEDRAWVTETAEHVIVWFRWDDDEGDDWIEGDGLLDPLLEARAS